MVEHDGGGPDLAYGLAMFWLGDVGGGAVDGFEEGGVEALAVDVAGGGDADGAGRRRGAEVGEDVAEEVGGYDDVEAVGVEDEVGGEDVRCGICRGGCRGRLCLISWTRSSQ